MANISAYPSTSVKAGESITLTATNVESCAYWGWYPGTYLIGQSMNPTAFTCGTPGAYTVYFRTYDDVWTLIGEASITLYVTANILVSSVTITQGGSHVASVSLNAGSALQLGATISPSNASNPTLSWGSYATGIATVNQSGYVTGVSSGTTTITCSATDGSGAGDSVTVTVNPPPDTTAPIVTGISFSNVTSNGFRVTASCTDNVGVVSCRFPTWTTASGQDDIIWYTGVNDGSGYFHVDVSTANHGGQSGQYTVHVYPKDAAGNESSSGSTVNVPSPTIPVTSIAVYAPGATPVVGNTGQFTKVVSPSNATNQTVQWSSSNSSIASVNANTGLVTYNAVGGCDIYCIAQDGSGVYGTTSIVVYPVNVRPPDWGWSYSMYSGGAVHSTTVTSGVIEARVMPYQEWNNFCTRINDFRKYKNNGIANNYSFTTVARETGFTPAIFNQASSAISLMVTGCPTATSGNITADMINLLRDKLNSIT